MSTTVELDDRTMEMLQRIQDITHMDQGEALKAVIYNEMIAWERVKFIAEQEKRMTATEDWP